MSRLDRQTNLQVSMHLCDAFTQKPISKKVIASLYLDAKCKILGPKGDILKELSVRSAEKSVQGCHFVIPEDAAGGNYTIRVEHLGMGIPSAERKVEVRGFQNPRLNSQLEFVKKGYGAGERAIATLSVKRAEGGVPEKAQIKFTARIDGKETNTGSTVLDSKGNCMIEFDLPKKIDVGDGTLTCTIIDGGVVETASKTIPILLQSINCDVYPEGGALVEGLDCGIYIEASTPFGEPADLIADIVDSKKNVVGTISTHHEGRGKGHFIPKSGETYSIAVTKPTGITNLIAIPKAKTTGVSLQAVSDVYLAQEAVKFTLASSKKGEFKVSVYKRDKELSSVKVVIKEDGDKTDVVFTLSDSTESDGVLRVTVFENEKPLAERLIFRKALDSISLTVNSDYKSYCPGDHAKMTVKAVDSKGKPVSTYLTVTVTDETVLESKEKRKQPPRLNAMVFLEKEVSNLEDAQIYFSNDPKADSVIDLLLGTQGWRRFVFSNLNASLSKDKDRVERIACVHEGTLKPKPVIRMRNRNVFFNEGMAFGAQDDVKFENEILINDEFDDGGESEDEDECGSEKGEMVPPIEFLREPMQFQEVEKPMDVIKQEKVKEVDDVLPVAKNEKLMGGDRMDEKEKMTAPLHDQLEMKMMAPKQEPKGFFAQVIGLFKSPVAKEDICDELQLHDEIQEEDRAWIDDDIEDDDANNEWDENLIREFAHIKRSDRRAGDRVDFQETLYWNPCVKTNKEGVAEIQFDLSDSVTSFHVLVDAFSKKGLFGSGDKLIQSKEPFYLEPKLPLEVTAGDVINIPVVVVNSSMENLSVTVKNALPSCMKGLESSKIEIKTDERKRLMFDVQVEKGNSSVPLTISGSSGPFSDKVTRMVKVVPKGYPLQLTDGGMMKANETKTFKFTIPKSVDPTSITTSLLFMPTPAASLQSALAALLQEPSGCFEQTSTTTYPNVIAHQYLTSHHGVDPDMIKKSYGLIEKGYKRLITFECKEGGYEWFGSGPGHEALTAYGTLEFIDMAKIYPVDPVMLSRTKSWLMSRRDGKGGFLRNAQALDDFGGAPTNTTNAYILWSLTEAGEGGLDKEIDFLLQGWKDQKDTYFLGLVAGCLYNIRRSKDAEEIATKLIDSQQDDGSVKNAVTSITRSGGDSLNIETTAIAIIVWLNNDEKFAKYTEKAIQWLSSRCKAGRFGNTQGTILALKAIVKYDKMRAAPQIDGHALVKIDGKEMKVPILKSSPGTVTTPSFASSLTEGEHTCEISLSDGLSLPFAFAIDYFAEKPDSSKDCILDLTTKLNSSTYEEGSGGEMMVDIKNLSKDKLGMVVAIVGLPGGIEPRHEQLQELIKMEKASAYEIRGREVIFYFRGVKELQEIQLKLDIIARIPGKFKAPSSRVYLYYTDEHKKWVDGTSCEIIAK